MTAAGLEEQGACQQLAAVPVFRLPHAPPRLIIASHPALLLLLLLLPAAVHGGDGAGVL